MKNLQNSGFCSKIRTNDVSSVNIFKLFAITATLLSGCASVGQNTGAFANKTEVASPEIFNAVEYDNQNNSKLYTPKVKEEVFRYGDQVIVTVNGFDEFSGIYNVDRSGQIFLGHIGQVQIAGLTIPEVQSKLHQNYNRCCLVNPNVSIEREGQEFGKIVVDGAVNDAGVFEIDNIITLSEAVALGGGASELANTETVMLARVINGERKVSPVNLKNIQLAGDVDPLVYPNDVIFVQDSAGRMIYNDFIKTIPLISAIIFGVTR